MSRYAHWFRAAVVFGLVFVLLVVVPSAPPWWRVTCLGFAVAYAVVIRHPLRWWRLSWLVVLSWFAIAFRFSLLVRSYGVIGGVSLVLGILMGVLLSLAMMHQRRTCGAENRRPWKVVLIEPAILAAALAVAAGLTVWNKLYREIPQDLGIPPGTSESERRDIEFKYGSIGAERADGIPLWIWLVLPRVFPEKMPVGYGGGYGAFGMAWEEGRPLPVGLSVKTIGVPRVAVNCAMCHTATYRTEARGETQLALGGPASQLRFQEYFRFLFACASDPRFTPDIILAEIEYNIRMTPLDWLLYRYVIVPETQRALLKKSESLHWMDDRPDWGPGRLDPFNPAKFDPHLLAMNASADKTIGTSDIQPLWGVGQGQRKYHWDGLTAALRDSVRISMVSNGAPRSLAFGDRSAQLANAIQKLQPPPYPFAVNRELAEQGAVVFRQLCANCHNSEGEQFGKVVPLSEIGTDPHRWESWSDEAAKRMNEFLLTDTFRKTPGYQAGPLKGLWLLAPYLHNGSVPTLDALLRPQASRPALFARGNDLLDQATAGFVWQRDGRSNNLFDTTQTGNANTGHEGSQYGTDLSEPDRMALLEYLKTL